MSSSAWNLSYADDPSDWDQEHSHLAALDSSLRCALCYDIFTAPVAIKDCAHTFCSACIRRAINKPGEEMGSRCPSCMSRNVYDSSLMPQPALEIVAQNWRAARPKLYDEQSKLAALRRQLEEQAASASTSVASVEGSGLPHKRAKLSSDLNVPESSSPPRRRSTRTSASHLRRNTHGNTEGQSSTFFDGSEDDSDYIDEEVASKAAARAQTQKDDEKKDYRQMQANDLADCPLCGHSFTLVALNRHLDKGTCSPGDPEPSPQERGLSTASKDTAGTAARSGWFQKSSPSNTTGTPSSSNANGNGFTAPRRKLVRPNYDMVKLPDLKRLLDEHKLSTHGDRKRLVERHRMWANLFNANLDASEKMRKTERELRRELETWERAQDYAANHGGVSDKRAKTWTMDHADDFKRLAQQARESHLRDRKKHRDEQIKETAGEGDQITAVDNAETALDSTVDAKAIVVPSLVDERPPSSSPPQIVESFSA